MARWCEEINQNHQKSSETLDFRVVRSDVYDTKFEGGKNEMAEYRIESNCNSDKVKRQFGCPNCKNQIMDELVWLDDETVKCTRCKTEYKITENKGGQR
jgi:hypothetical protein